MSRINHHDADITVAIAGNPNVGKSTLFNTLTGMNQHTGNWAGKTIDTAIGICSSKKHGYMLVDIPGTYSLNTMSKEEELAKKYLIKENPDAVIVVCDATCIERSLLLVLQVRELCPQLVVCVNLIDEARRKNIVVNCDKLSKLLGVPVIPTVGYDKKSVTKLLHVLDALNSKKFKSPIKVNYPDDIEDGIRILEKTLAKIYVGYLDHRWLSLKLLTSGIEDLIDLLPSSFFNDEKFLTSLEEAKEKLIAKNPRELNDILSDTLVKEAEKIGKDAVIINMEKAHRHDRNLDKIFTGKYTGFPFMVLLLLFVFWVTVTGANYPSAALGDLLFNFGEVLRDGLLFINSPTTLISILIDGIYKVLAWVISVMLPPMAIFFPMFTILEDAGYLPRVAYNLDNGFRRCGACGKQALTMCMGFGCNAAGVVGCRIIDSPRERLLAVLTNSFVPCNGRFPTLIAIISVFFIGAGAGIFSGIMSAVILTSVILLGVVATFVTTRFLSKTFLKGVPSSFTLELPPYRRPRFGSVIVRSLLDRTLFVLARAVLVAAPAGLVIWAFANINVGDTSILTHVSDFLDPLGQLMGLDGMILLAFILGLPANEIVVPILLMGYLSQGTLLEADGVEHMRQIFTDEGWTITTAISMMIFMLFHWPCSTTLLTIKKETKSLKWTTLAFILPTTVGVGLCVLFNAIMAWFN